MLLHGGGQWCHPVCAGSTEGLQPLLWIPSPASHRELPAKGVMLGTTGPGKALQGHPTQATLSVGPALCQLHWAYPYKKVVVWRWGEGPLSCHPGGMEPSCRGAVCELIKECQRGSVCAQGQCVSSHRVCTGAVCELTEDVHRGTAGTWTPLSGYLSRWPVCKWGVWDPLQR